MTAETRSGSGVASDALFVIWKTGGGQAYILNVASRLGIRLGCPMERAFAIQGLVAVVSRFNSQAIKFASGVSTAR